MNVPRIDVLDDVEIVIGLVNEVLDKNCFYGIHENIESSLNKFS